MTLAVIRKALPTQSDLHVNRPLTTMSIAYIQDETKFIAARAFPVVPVSKQSDLYWKLDRGDFLRAQAKKRAPGTESEGGGWKQSTDPYFADVWAFHKDVSDQERANDDLGTLDITSTRFVTGQLLMKRELNWTETYFQSGVWTYNINGVSTTPTPGTSVWQWSDYTNSNPIEDVATAATTIQITTGYRPNTLVLGRQVYDVLKNHPDLIDRLNRGQTTGAAKVTQENMAALFEVDRILIMDTIVNTKNETLTFDSFTNAFIGGKKALLMYSASAPSMWEASGGYTFAWTGYQPNAANGQGITISKFRMEQIKSDRVEGEMAYAHKLTGPDLGYFFNTIVA